MTTQASVWFRRVGYVMLALTLGGGAVSLSHCFSPELPACAYRCNATEPRCPDEYECRDDGYCHLKGSTESCPYTQDLVPPPVIDLSGFSIDLSKPVDMSSPGDAMSNPG
jgi:hypothetical protein